MSLKEHVLKSIGYDPMLRIWYIDRTFNNYRLYKKAYTKKPVERFVRKKFKTVRVF